MKIFEVVDDVISGFVVKILLRKISDIDEELDRLLARKSQCLQALDNLVGKKMDELGTPEYEVKRGHIRIVRSN